jgi:hypothetical protein
MEGEAATVEHVGDIGACHEHPVPGEYDALRAGT